MTRPLPLSLRRRRAMQSCSAASAHRQSFARCCRSRTSGWHTGCVGYCPGHFQKSPSSHLAAMLTMQRRALFLTLLSALSVIALVAASKGSALSVCTFFQHFCKSLALIHHPGGGFERCNLRERHKTCAHSLWFRATHCAPFAFILNMLIPARLSPAFARG
jgi:hypothetical protein